MTKTQSSLPEGIEIPKLIPGQHAANKATATAFIAKHLFRITEFNTSTGVFEATDHTKYRVAAYSTGADKAMIGTPDNPNANIQSHQEKALMCRQLKEGTSIRWVVYELDSKKLPNMTNVEWKAVDKEATCYWVIFGKNVTHWTRSSNGN
jgi:hypothetical protein